MSDTKPFCDVCKKPVDVVQDLSLERHEAYGIREDPREIHVECHNEALWLAVPVDRHLQGYHLFGVHGGYYQPPDTPPMTDAEIQRVARKPVGGDDVRATGVPRNTWWY